MTTEVISAATMTLFKAKPKMELEIERSTAAVNPPVDAGFVKLSGGRDHVVGQGIVKMQKTNRERRMKIGQKT